MGWGLSEAFVGFPTLILGLNHNFNFSPYPPSQGSPLPGSRVAHFQPRTSISCSVVLIAVMGRTLKEEKSVKMQK